MASQDESKRLVQTFSDKSRRVKKVGNRFHVPHKFADDGSVITDETLEPKRHISRLTLDDLKFLELWRDNKWDDAQTLAKAGLDADQVRKTFKKLEYFKTEDARIKALALQATPELVLSKDITNLATGELSDTHHKSLDRIAKITGAFKTAESGTTTINVLNLNLSPDQEKATKEFFDTLAISQ